MVFSGISEYFFGTETRRFYNNLKNFYMEFLENPHVQMKELESLENTEIICGKVAPNVIEAVTILNYMFTGNLEYQLMIIAEGIRNMAHFGLKGARDGLKDRVEEIKKENREKGKLENIMNELDF